MTFLQNPPASQKVSGPSARNVSEFRPPQMPDPPGHPAQRMEKTMIITRQIVICVIYMSRTHGAKTSHERTIQRNFVGHPEPCARREVTVSNSIRIQPQKTYSLDTRSHCKQFPESPGRRPAFLERCYLYNPRASPQLRRALAGIDPITLAIPVTPPEWPLSTSRVALAETRCR